jgi:MYXO-CTERM domain-containing protein
MVTLSNNVIENNVTSSPDANGAGVFFDEETDLKILNNVIRNNTGGHGAGLAGGGDHVLVQGNTVQGNVATGDHGGGMWISAESADIDGNLVASNSSTSYGGGIVCFGMYGDNTHFQDHLTNNVVTDNRGFGAIFIDDGAQASIENNLVYRNDNGIYVDGPNTVAVVDRCTMADNGVTSAGPNDMPAYAVGLVVEQDGSSSDYVQVTIKNSIIYGNTGGDYLALKAPSNTTISYTLTENSLDGTDAMTGPGNITGDPLFADAAHDDYHLQSRAGRWTPTVWVSDPVSSPAIDRGDPASDFSLEPPPNGGRVNLGAWADTDQASKSGSTFAGGGPTGGARDGGRDGVSSGTGQKSGGGCSCAAAGARAPLPGAGLAAGALALALLGRRRRG